MPLSIANISARRVTTAAQQAARWVDLELEIQACRESYFATVTTRRSYDTIRLSCELNKVLRRANRAYFGAAFERRGAGFIVYVVQERTINKGLHAHMLLGVPDDWGRKANPCMMAVPDLIISNWLKLDTPRYRAGKAQDVREIYRHDTLLAYVRKDLLTLDDLQNVDVLNIHTSKRP